MTEQELRKKIIETLEKGGRNFLKSKKTNVSIYEYYADALIAAGLKFDDMTEADRQRYNAYKIIEPQIKGCLNREKNLEKRLAEAEHSSARAERAFGNSIENFVKFQYEQNGYELDKLFLEDVRKKSLQQAEKELQEERKDE